MEKKPTQPKRIPYEKVAEGLRACFCGYEERDCENCPYEKYNEHMSIYGDDPISCMEHLSKDAKAWGNFLGSFTHCATCSCWSKRDEEGHLVSEPDKERYCQIFGTMTLAEEFCARGCTN